MIGTGQRAQRKRDRQSEGSWGGGGGGETGVLGREREGVGRSPAQKQFRLSVFLDGQFLQEAQKPL